MAFPPLVSSGANIFLDFFVCLAPFHYSGLEFKDTFLNEASPDLLSSFTALITICKIICSLET